MITCGLSGTTPVPCSGSCICHRKQTCSLGSVIQYQWAVFSVLPHFSPECPFNWKRHMALTESNFPTTLCGSLSGVTLNYMNNGRNFPRSQSRKNHMKQKIHKWCPFAFIFALFIATALMQYHRLGGLWTADVYSSQFWRLEVWGLGASMVRWWPLPVVDSPWCPHLRRGSFKDTHPLHGGQYSLLWGLGFHDY